MKIKQKEAELINEQFDSYVSLLVENDSVKLIKKLEQISEIVLDSRFEDHGFTLKLPSGKTFGIYFSVEGLIYIVKDFFESDEPLEDEENIILITSQKEIGRLYALTDDASGLYTTISNVVGK